MFQGNQGVGYRGMFQVVEIARQGDRYIDVGTNIGPSIGGMDRYKGRIGVQRHCAT